MTYAEIQTVYNKHYFKTIKTCWIADAKRELGLTKRKAYNRINPDSVEYPCPSVEIKNRIIDIILAF